jgi:hypothetical protein
MSAGLPNCICSFEQLGAALHRAWTRDHDNPIFTNIYTIQRKQRILRDKLAGSQFIRPGDWDHTIHSRQVKELILMEKPSISHHTDYGAFFPLREMGA